jgi:hypothetical protein
MTGSMIAADLDVKCVTVETTRRLLGRQCIMQSSQGWMITDIGRTALETGVLP